MTRALIFTLLIISPAALAQESDFVLPDFVSTDAGVSAPSEPPLPQLQAPSEPRVPPVPVWGSWGGSATVLFTALTEYFVSADVTLVYTIAGKPLPSELVPGEVEGWLAQLGTTLFLGQGGGPLCDGSLFCATRGGGGAALKVGWARGMPSASTGVTRTQTMYFGQVDVAFSYFGIESAPLAPGVQTPELLTRLRAGLHFTSATNRSTSTGFTLLFAAVFQAVPLSRGTQGVSLGLSAGVGF